MDWFIVGLVAAIWLLLNALFLMWLYMTRCRHQWERVETKDYPPACTGDLKAKNIWFEDYIKLKQAHTTYVQRCTRCGLERYTTVSVPEV